MWFDAVANIILMGYVNLRQYNFHLISVFLFLPDPRAQVLPRRTALLGNNTWFLLTYKFHVNPYKNNHAFCLFHSLPQFVFPFTHVKQTRNNVFEEFHQRLVEGIFTQNEGEKRDGRWERVGAWSERRHVLIRVLKRNRAIVSNLPIYLDIQIYFSYYRN